MARTREEDRAYQSEYRKRKRRERGLQKQGRKPNTPEQNEQAKENRREWQKEWQREYFKNNPVKRILWTAKNRAKRKGLECTLEESDITIPKYCPYLGIELIPNTTKDTPRTAVASLDRIDSSKGYTPDNIEVISWLANTMKNNATEEQLIMFARKVLERYEGLGVGHRDHHVSEGPST